MALQAASQRTVYIHSLRLRNCTVSRDFHISDQPWCRIGRRTLVVATWLRATHRPPGMGYVAARLNCSSGSEIFSPDLPLLGF
jgi:hypothetical protein